MRWWLALLTSSFVGLFALTTSAVLRPRQLTGVNFEVANGQVFLREVAPGSKAERAGLRAGDRVVSVDRLRLGRAMDLRVLVTNMPAHTAVAWEVERNGAAMVFVTEPAGRMWQPTGLSIVMLASLGLSLVLGLVLGWRRYDDPTALLGAWLLTAMGSVLGPAGLRSIGAVWRDLPTPLGVIIWPAAFSSALTPALLFAFLALMPRPVMSRRVLLVSVLPMVLVAVYMTTWLMHVVYAPERALTFPIPAWLQVTGPLLYPAYFIAAVVLLVVNLRRTTDPTERRRARILLVGSAAGAAGLMPVAVVFAGEAVAVRIDDWVLVLAGAVFGVLPLSFAYATLRHRLFDLRIIVRLGLQYALLRGALLALAPLSVALLAVDVLRHADQPFRQILIDRGWTYLAIAGAAVLTHAQRQPWMAALDRRFFRERYAAQQVLRQVVDDVARATSLESVADRVLARIMDALHPRRAALFVRGPGTDCFGALAAVPAGVSLPPLDSESALARIVRALDKSVTLSSESGLRRDLPKPDLDWLAAADVELLFPVTLGETGREVLLALGPRLSEEPYSNEDVELLSAVATSLAIVSRAEAMRGPSPVEIPAVQDALGGRYRVGRLIGEGGMGTVWEAHDEALDRVVAIKRLRTSAEGGPHDVERFKREARAAARLSHPNVVVVHDFGVDKDQHPFLVMERLIGRTLRQHLSAERRLTPTAATTLLSEAAAGIAAAHAQQLVHRDLKPENVFLCGDASRPTVKILDFGIARSLAFGTTSAQTTSGAITGTLLYMAPEQLAGGPPNSCWDIWALGVIAYEMLAGAHPLASTDALGCIPALLAGRIDPIKKHVPDAPDAWQAFFDRALSIDPANRPSTAPGFAAEFAGLIFFRT